MRDDEDDGNLMKRFFIMIELGGNKSYLVS